MNANELADYLDNNVEAMLFSEQSYIDQAATMLRQQQAEIEALKKIIKRLIVNWTNDFKNYKYNSDVPEQNKIRDDVFAILKKANEK
jgi:hypothetical protein